MMERLKGKLLILCGVPGSGKTTLQNYLLANHGFTKVITHTTRPKRVGEINGIDYYFEDKTSFFTKNYLESVSYAGNYYGSSYEGLKQALQVKGRAVIVLDTKGAATYVAKLAPENVVVVFVKIPREIQAKRLQKRGDSPSQIKQRLASQEAKRDQKLPKALENQAYELENLDLSKTYQKLSAFVTATFE